MYCPLFGERVWMNGHPGAFIVTQTNYAAGVASISPIDKEGPTHIVPFEKLSEHPDFSSSPDEVATRASSWDLLRSSRMCTWHSRVLIRDLRETIGATCGVIEKSMALIAETDKIIARTQNLGIAQRESRPAPPSSCDASDE